LKLLWQSATAESQAPDGATAKLGIPRQTLDSKIKALQINKHRFKTSNSRPNAYLAAAFIAPAAVSMIPATALGCDT